MKPSSPASLPGRRVRAALLAGLLLPAAGSLAAEPLSSNLRPTVVVAAADEPVAAGPFEPSWTSLANYEVPEWFRDAKFGIWAHWGPQCEPEQGDWYARSMYSQGTRQYEYQTKHYGHPSQAGFKDVIHAWKAEHWNPEELVALYARAGAQYFVALANHHDNFDLWPSKYQPWNATKLGPQKDIVGGWAAAARGHGLRFGVSVHAAHAWSWYEVAQGADATGPLAGVPYDGKLTAADGRGTWWDGLDPQDLYEQRHTPSPNFGNLSSIHARWNWGNGVTPPDAAYCERFYNRTVDLINQVQPDLVYFDDTALPLWPVSDAGLKIAAHFYNSTLARHGGKLEAVLCGKILAEDQRRAMIWDIERGQSNVIEPEPWQTDTCIGQWHYRRSIYDEKGYKSARTVLQTLADIVSKNGNLLLSVPVRSDGTIDDEERRIVEGIADWMAVNREAIFATRPWKVFGEGPASAGAELSAQGFNEGKGKPFGEEDVRFTQSKDGRVLYVIALVPPTKPLRVKALGSAAGQLDRGIARVQRLGASAPAKWQRTADALEIESGGAAGSDQPVVFKIALQ
ncbi:MAG TPA: alpha-L-fucosidase [Opitutus sp.]|nr:alpha-L-fucosidase [Opitutus sp.]